MNKLLCIVVLGLSLLATPAYAVVTEKLIMVRSEQGFPETMSSLQAAIKKQGYTLSHVQRVDIGLTSSGYKTDKYRIVFFGKADEIHALMQSHPEMIPYLPLKIAIFAEGAETILIGSNPLAFIELFKGGDLEKMFRQWNKDVIEILNTVQFHD